MRVALLIVLLFFCCVPRVQASELVIRALLPNPESGQEWIAIENTSSASYSAQGVAIRDGAGSVKSFVFTGEFFASEIRILSQTTTKISLNNDTDWVELTRASQLEHMSEIYEAAPKGQVWLQTTQGWSFVPLSDWEDRLSRRDWEETGNTLETSPKPSAQPSASPSVFSSPIVKATLRASSSPGTRPLSSSQPVSSLSEVRLYEVPRLLAHVASSSSVASGAVQVSTRQEPDWDKEVEELLAWRKQLRGWSSVVLLGASITLLYAVPKALRCYNDLYACLEPFDSS